MMNNEQLNFDFFSETAAPKPEELTTCCDSMDQTQPGRESEADKNTEVQENAPDASSTASSKLEPSESPLNSAGEIKNYLMQVVCSFFLSLNVEGMGFKVPLRRRRIQAGAAGFCLPEQNGTARRAGSTVIVEIFEERSQCFQECVDAEALLLMLTELNAMQEELEAQIRIEEPHLRQDNELFNDFALFDYEQSKNKKYQELRRKQSQIRRSLYKGGRLEAIRNEQLADFLYIAVPEDIVAEEEVPDDWGLIYIHTDHTFTVIKKAKNQNCTLANHLLLMRNIAAATIKNVFFSCGVAPGRNQEENEIKFTYPPRRRRKIFRLKK